MKKLICNALLLGLLCFTTAERSEAQLGLVLDWINQLSGPGILRGGVSGVFASKFLADDSRVNFTLLFPLNEYGVTPANANINLYSLRTSLELPIKQGVLAVAPGFSVHRFEGDVNGFWHFSIPMQLAIRPFWVAGPKILKGLSFGPNLNYFFEFNATDFQPLVVQVSRDGSELAFGLSISYLWIP